MDSSSFLLDLGLLKSITIVPELEAVKVRGAVLMKELATAVAEAGRCTSKLQDICYRPFSPLSNMVH